MYNINTFIPCYFSIPKSPNKYVDGLYRSTHNKPSAEAATKIRALLKNELKPLAIMRFKVIMRNLLRSSSFPKKLIGWRACRRTKANRNDSNAEGTSCQVGSNACHET